MPIKRRSLWATNFVAFNKVAVMEEEGLSVIAKYAVAEGLVEGVGKYTSDAYGELYKIAYVNEPDAFLDQCREMESAFMQNTHGSNPDAFHKKTTKLHLAGDWKYREYLPKAYQSAKSVLKTALENGVSLTSETIGKTELEKRTKALKEPRAVENKICPHCGWPLA